MYLFSTCIFSFYLQVSLQIQKTRNLYRNLSALLRLLVSNGPGAIGELQVEHRPHRWYNSFRKLVSQDKKTKRDCGEA